MLTVRSQVEAYGVIFLMILIGAMISPIIFLWEVITLMLMFMIIMPIPFMETLLLRGRYENYFHQVGIIAVILCFTLLLLDVMDMLALH